MNHERSLFPHNKIDWKISDLTQKSGRAGGNILMLVQLMKLHLSKIMFHDGGDQDSAQAIRHGKRILQEDPANVDALSMLGLALVYLGREDDAERYLGRANSHGSESTFLHLAYGVLYKVKGEIADTIEHWNKALDISPKAWELHRLIGTAYLWHYHDDTLELAHQQKLAQRSLFHFIRAMNSRTELDLEPSFLMLLGYSCLINGYNREAERYFNRLRQSQINVDETSYYLGLVAYELKKFNNAVQHFRTFLSYHPDHTDIIAKKARAWYKLGEYKKAKLTAQDCLRYEPFHVEARLVLGQSLVEMGDTQDAVRVFIDTLSERPDHIESFKEVVSLRLQVGDYAWLEKSLLQEVEDYSSLPNNADVDFTEVARQRIGVVLGSLMEVGSEMINIVLGAIHCTQDEHLRFALWETAVCMTQDSKASQTIEEMSESERNFDLERACSALGAATLIPEVVLVDGLRISENDIRESALNRYDPAYDVSEHKNNEETERQRSRGYQSLLLLAIASHKTESAKTLLRDWSQQDDIDMSVAAKIGLALNGEMTAFDDLESLTHTSNRVRLLSNIKKKVFRISERREFAEFLTSETEKCQLCSESGSNIHHFIRTFNGAVCSNCITECLDAPPAGDDAICLFCNKNFFSATHLVNYKDVVICSTCQNQSQQLLEQDDIHQFFRERTIYFGK